MTDGIVNDATGDATARWEYKVVRVVVGPVAFHAQAFADSEALLLFLKRPAPPHSPAEGSGA